MARFPPILTVASAVLIAACHGQQSAPAAPSSSQTVGSLTAFDACASPAFTISGVVTGYQGGPLDNVGIALANYPYRSVMNAKTDRNGRYRACGTSASMVALQFYRSDYATAFRYALPPHDQTINLELRPRFEVPSGGGTVNAIIRGDEFEAGDDYFGGSCVRSACKIVDFGSGGCPCPNRRAEITLRWADVSSQLAVYFSNTDTYFPPAGVPPATRYCCSSPVVATYEFNADFDRFAIGFEQAAGGQPGPNDSQPFELAIRPIR